LTADRRDPTAGNAEDAGKKTEDAEGNGIVAVAAGVEDTVPDLFA
jgi:hypothetical protein